MVQFVKRHTDQNGADAVLITASTKGNEIISQAAQMSRKRGRIVLVGVVGLELNRSEFYEKELSFQVSCSYGPGRYDPKYEQGGLDYPLAYVRWTEKRNFEAILQALSAGQLKLDELITQQVSLKNYRQIYDNMSQSGAIASILEYPKTADYQSTVAIKEKHFQPANAVIGIIGAGNFTKMTLLPALTAANAQIKSIVSAGGLNATSLAKKFDISQAGTDHQQILDDPEIDLVMITTRHHLHAQMVIECLKAGKHVFVEKPLAININQLKELMPAIDDATQSITVGFNRRFSPLVKQAKALLGKSPGPMNMTLTMNAGFIPSDVWVHDLEIGGGRVIGEACHYIDLASYLCEGEVESVCMTALGPNPQTSTDNASILLKYDNGSNAVINYFSNGHKSYSKERVDMHYGNKTLIIDNFRKLYNYGFQGPSRASGRQDKGHKKQFELLLKSISSGGGPLISLPSLINTTLASFKALESLQSGSWKEVRI